MFLQHYFYYYFCARNSLLKLICHNDSTKQKMTCHYIHLSCLYQYSKVESAESTVDLQEYRCFKLLNEISCIPQAKLTLVKKDINVFCTVIADKYIQGGDAKLQCLVKGYTLQHFGHPQTINKLHNEMPLSLQRYSFSSDTMSRQQLN